jgi:hypothetical protein
VEILVCLFVNQYISQPRMGNFISPFDEVQLGCLTLTIGFAVD